MFNFKGLFIGAIILVAVFLSTLNVGAYNDGAISINPTSGSWNYPGSFIVTNNSDHVMVMKWLVDCWNEEVCADRSGETSLEPGQSMSEGAGFVCGKWQLDLWWDGGSWGGIAEESCDDEGGEPPPCDKGCNGGTEHRVCIIQIAGRITSSSALISVVYDDAPGRPETITVYGSPDEFSLQTDQNESGTIRLIPGSFFGDTSYVGWWANGCYFSETSSHPNGQPSAPMTVSAPVAANEPCLPSGKYIAT